MACDKVWLDKGLVRVFHDKVSATEVLQENLALHGDPRFDLIEFVLNDFSAVTDFSVSEQEITIISSIDNVAAISKPRLNIALIATYPPLLTFLQLYVDKMQGAQYPVAILSNYDDALAWASVRH